MTGDLDFLHAHLPDFPEYGDEYARNGSDMRVRAFVGKALVDAQDRVYAALDDATRERFDALVFKSQFSDNAYLKRIGHLNLAGDEIAAIAREDRRLVEVATGLAQVDTASAAGVLSALEAQFEARHLTFER